jgi:hypothetical protein
MLILISGKVCPANWEAGKWVPTDKYYTDAKLKLILWGFKVARNTASKF